MTFRVFPFIKFHFYSYDSRLEIHISLKQKHQYLNKNRVVKNAIKHIVEEEIMKY